MLVAWVCVVADGKHLIVADKPKTEFALDTTDIPSTKCGMILASFLLLAATDVRAVPPVTLDCNRDSAGICLPIEPSPPARLLRGEQDQAAAIYRRYWICYWNNLKVHEEFGTSDTQRAMKVFASALNACASQKELADRNMDNLLRPLKIYGSNARKRFVRDHFRSSSGDAFLDRTSSAAGLHDEYDRMREAYQRFMLAQIRNARNK